MDLHPPTPPAHWSYSALAAWRECPRRWWFENSRHGDDARRYPRRPHPKAVEGTVVHRALDRFAKFIQRECPSGARYAEARARFPLRRELVAALDSYIAELIGNPRVDPQAIRGKLDLDACANAFRLAAPGVWDALGMNAAKREAASSTSALGDAEATAGAEVWLQTHIPRIAGQIDLVARGRLTDYKTGAEKESHLDQLRFYALLYWLRHGRRVDVLRLIYTSSGEIREADAPGEAELSALAKSLETEIAVADALILSSRQPPAKPVQETCRFCQVRQLCDEYWQALPAWSALPAATALVSTEPLGEWADAEVRFVERATVSCGLSCAASTAAWGPVGLRVGSTKCAADAAIRGARLLGATVVRRGVETEVQAQRDTEVFWFN